MILRAVLTGAVLTLMGWGRLPALPLLAGSTLLGLLLAWGSRKTGHTHALELVEQTARRSPLSEMSPGAKVLLCLAGLLACVTARSLVLVLLLWGAALGVLLGPGGVSLRRYLRLLALPEDVRRMVSGGKLSFGHAKVLLGLPNEDLMRQAAAEVAAQNLNVRQTEALCKKLTKPAKPPKAKDDNFTRPKRAVEVEAALKEVTGSEVHVDYKDGKGSLKIDFYSDDMLQKFVSLLGMYDPEG